MTEIYLNNPNLKNVGVKTDYTRDQVKEIIKCKNDPKYFIKNYCKIISLDDGLVDFNLHDYQEKQIESYHNNRNTIVLSGRQSGKCVHRDTKITIQHDDLYHGEPFEIKIGDFYEWMNFVNYYSFICKPNP